MSRGLTTRRSFLAFAFAGTAATTLLAACGTAAPAPPATSAPAAGAGTSAPQTQPTVAPTPVASAAPPAAATAQPTVAPAAASQPTAPASQPAAAAPAGLKQVPRNRTVITAGLGGEAVGGFTDVDNQNPYLSGFSRSGYNNGAAEPLFHYMMLSDQFIP